MKQEKVVPLSVPWHPWTHGVRAPSVREENKGGGGAVWQVQVAARELAARDCKLPLPGRSDRPVGAAQQAAVSDVHRKRERPLTVDERACAATPISANLGYYRGISGTLGYSVRRDDASTTSSPHLIVVV